MSTEWQRGPGGLLVPAAEAGAWQARRLAAGQQRAAALAGERRQALDEAARQLEAELDLAEGEMTHGTAVITPDGTVRSLDCTCSPCARARTEAHRQLLDNGKAAMAAEPAPDPAGEILAALREFDTWLLAGPRYPDELADPARAPAGLCKDCHLGLEARNGRCFWCQLAVTVRLENKGLESLARHGPDHVPCPCRACRRRQFRHAVMVTLLIWAACTLILLTATGAVHWRLG